MSLSERSESKTPWFVYIAQASTGRYYVGIANNISRRLADHNAGRGSRFAKDQGPFNLAYSVRFESKSEARKREIQLKGWTKQKKEKLIKGVWT